MLAVAIAAVPSLAQTTTELLQKGIFAQETEGNLDNAIMIYRQIVNSAPSQRDLAAQAQYRLAQSLLQKGDLTNASTEFSKLARDYADYQKLISSLAAQAGRQAPLPGGGVLRAEGGTIGVGGRGTPAGPAPALKAAELLAARQFNGSPVVVRGKIVNATWVNPSGMILVDPDNGADGYLFLTAPPRQLARQMNPSTFKLGDIVTVTGVLSTSSDKLDRRIAARADTIAGPDGQIVFNRATLTALTLTPEQETTVDFLKAQMDTSKRELENLRTRLQQLRQQYDGYHPQVQATQVSLKAAEQRVAEIAQQLAVAAEHSK